MSLRRDRRLPLRYVGRRSFPFGGRGRIEFSERPGVFDLLRAACGCPFDVGTPTANKQQHKQEQYAECSHQEVGGASFRRRSSFMDRHQRGVAATSAPQRGVSSELLGQSTRSAAPDAKRRCVNDGKQSANDIFRCVRSAR
jgi:hypothetical protein